MQHSTSQYDDFAGVPRAHAGAGCRRRTIAPGHRRHSSPRCSCRVVPPICDARLIGLIPGVATQAGARNGFAEPRDRAPKIAAIATSGSAETARPSFEPRKSPQIGAYSSETGKRRFVQECVVHCRADCRTRTMQHSPSQYDDFAGIPCAQAGAGGGRRTIAQGHRRHSSPRCSRRVGPPICDAWPIGLIPGTLQLGPAPGTGLQSPETGRQKSPLSRPHGEQRPHAPRFNPRGNAGKSGPRARQDLNLQPSGYEPLALTIELRARNMRRNATVAARPIRHN